MNVLEDVTSLYKPGMDSRLKIVRCKISRVTEEDSKLKSQDNDNNEDEYNSFVGCDKGYVPYAEILAECSNIIELTPVEDQTTRTVQPSTQERLSKLVGPLFKVRTEQLPMELKAKVAMEWCFKRVPVAKQAMKMGMEKSQIRNVIYEFKTLRKANRKIGRFVNKARRKLEEPHIEWLAEFVKGRQLCGFTCLEARAYLLSNYPDLGSISVSSVRNTLHRNLNLSYKKLGGTNIKKVKPDNKSNLIEWLKLMISLLSDWYYLIFLDEFTVNRNTLRTYGWTQRGTPGRMLIRKLDFKMSFIVAIARWELKA